MCSQRQAQPEDAEVKDNVDEAQQQDDGDKVSIQATCAFEGVFGELLQVSVVMPHL